MWQLHSRLDKRLPLSYSPRAGKLLLLLIDINLRNETAHHSVPLQANQNDLSNSSGCTDDSNGPLGHFAGASRDKVSRVSHEVETLYSLPRLEPVGVQFHHVLDHLMLCVWNSS